MPSSSSSLFSHDWFKLRLGDETLERSKQMFKVFLQFHCKDFAGFTIGENGNPKLSSWLNKISLLQIKAYPEYVLLVIIHPFHFCHLGWN
ncbi:PREDICTED: uncharacterized protein LOC104742104 isoform X2 [Camelina sativa]|uniref:Uncharacterized protein LOC104742104 isoform X2 n=1 Tax=Camelina sativa TaxID=90675 RepID=A0ABM0VUQ9_CAMSA|nr:PREDICTED: uncharacterized protein LOC104742104 isoform X2 [Camelina sativa]